MSLFAEHFFYFVPDCAFSHRRKKAVAIICVLTALIFDDKGDMFVGPTDFSIFMYCYGVCDRLIACGGRI